MTQHNAADLRDLPLGNVPRQHFNIVFYVPKLKLLTPTPAMTMRSGA